MGPVRHVFDEFWNPFEDERFQTKISSVSLDTLPTQIIFIWKSVFWKEKVIRELNACLEEQQIPQNHPLVLFEFWSR